MDVFPSNAVAAIAAIRKGKLSVRELTSHCLASIDGSNSLLGALRAVSNEAALAAAIATDRLIEAGGQLPPLAGVPVVVKENCDTAGTPCSAGLPFRSDYVPPVDSAIVSRLREAGAIILGVSVSDPGAFGVRTMEVTHPYDASLTVGGSSGGSAAALAAGYCFGALGTDTGGSIRIPSACCGTVGLKPTFGLLPMNAIYPLVPSLDHVGPMAKTAADVSLIWEALFSGQQDNPPVHTIGYDPNWVREADTQIATEFELRLGELAQAGIHVKEIILPDLDEISQMHIRIFCVEGAAFHYAHFDQDISNYPRLAKDGFEVASRMSVADYLAACGKRAHFTRDVDRVLGEVDLILTPTLSVLGPRRDAQELLIAGRPRDFTLGMVRHTCLFNHTGHPVLAMPMKSSHQTPSPSLQVIGRHGSERRLLSFAIKVEGDQLAKLQMRALE